ncbi:MAG: histidine phosphatase family protein, partial [SAR324 cluster bacterium]|nr:histidine phosphatase family protein [SAR324 cluster bacterium]
MAVSSELVLQSSDLEKLSVPKVERRWETYNHLFGIKDLKNIYLAMRHGESEANTRRITASNPAYALCSFGLTDFGIRQVCASINAQSFLDSSTIICCSDLLRAKQSAEIAANELGVSDLFITPWLRERFFGDFDALDYVEYFHHIHRRDNEDPISSYCNCESVVSVQKRLSEGILQCEKEFSGKKILLVSHHDAIQILECVFSKTSPGFYAGSPDAP